MPTGNILIVTALLVYFVVHSLTASLWLKSLVARRWPRAMRYYRLGFNILAVALAMPLAALLWHYPGTPLWHWQGPWAYLANALALIAVLAFVYSLRMYDMSEFWGMRQLRTQAENVHDQERLKISTFHRYVRHPWYCMALVILWTRDLSTTQALTYLLLTLYFVIGSRLEERKLIAYHGEAYARYRRRVAGLIPLPWRTLSPKEARELEQYGCE